MNISQSDGKPITRLGSWASGTLAAVLLSIAAPVTVSAEIESIESLVQQQCTQVRSEGGDLTRYKAWIAAVKNQAANEFETSAKDVLRYSKEWLEMREKLFKAEQELEKQRHYASLVISLADGFDRVDRLSLEVVELKGELNKSQDSSEKQALQNRVAELEKMLTESWGYIRSGMSSTEVKAAKEYLGLKGHMNWENDVISSKEEFLGDFRYKINTKESNLQKRLASLWTERTAVEKKFEKAREDYEDSRLMLAAIEKIDQRIRLCASGQSGPKGALNATWMVSYIPPRQPTHRWCHSGQLVIEFDDAGQASDARITVDCTTSDVQMKKGGPWTRSNTTCPMPPRNWGQKLRITNVQADFASGQITAEVHHRDVSNDLGTLTGTIQRTGPPPYSYSGKGSMRFPSQDPASRRSHDWQSGPALKCQ